MVDTGILFINMKYSSHECLMTIWPLNSYSDIPTNQTFHQFHDLDTDLDLHRITSGFYGAFATVVACLQGTLTLPDNWFHLAFGTCLCSNCWDQFSRTCQVFSRLVTLNTPRYFLDFAFDQTDTMHSAILFCLYYMFFTFRWKHWWV